MTMESRAVFFARSMLVALAYGLAYAGLRESTLSSISHMGWVPMAALRFTCLLFFPTRYWTALLVGEVIPVGYQNYLCLAQFGWAWTLTGSIPPMLYAAAIVHLIRKQVLDFEKRVSQNLGCLLLGMFIVSLAVGLHDMFVYSLAEQHAPSEHPVPLWLYGTRLMTSNYLTILTVTPITLWLAESVRQAIMQHRFHIVIVSTLRDIHWRATGILLASIALLAILGYLAGEAMHVLVLCGILATLFVAAWRYGWQSAALVGAAANLGVLTLMPTRDDLLTIIAQCMIAAFMTCALLLGARTSASRSLARDLRLAEQQAMAAEQKAAAAREQARQELFTNERHRLSYATMLEKVFTDTRQEAIRVLDDVRAALPSSEIAKHYRQFDELQQTHKSLTDGLSPPAWLKLGGPDGPIAQSLEWLGARCEIELPSPISGLARLSTELSIAMYRMSCEAVAYLMKEAPSDAVRIAMAVREEQGKRPEVEIVLESLGEVLHANAELYTPFLLSLGASGLSVKALERRAQLYDGHMEVKRISERHMRMLLRVVDPAMPKAVAI